MNNSEAQAKAAGSPGAALRAWVRTEGLARAIDRRPTVSSERARGRKDERVTGGKAAVPSSDEPLVTIIFPVRNCGRYLAEAIESVLSQRYPAVELIVIDGASTDDTLDIVRRYEDRIQRWLSEPDRGLYDAINKGVALAHGELIHILNGDDLLAPGSIQKAVTLYREHGDCVCIKSPLQRIDERGRKLEIIDARDTAPFLPPGFPILHPSWYVPRKVYEQHGLYLPYFRVSGDCEYFYHLSVNGVRFIEAPEALARLRSGGMSHGLHGRHETLEIDTYYLGRARSLFLYGRSLYKKKRSALLHRVLGEHATGRLKRAVKSVTR